MTAGYVFAVVLALLTVVLIAVLLLRRRIREKYVGIWIMVALGVLVLSIFPRLATTIADWVGVQTPANLLFCVALVVLLFVALQLSVELTSAEEEIRTLAEEHAILRERVERLENRGPDHQALPTPPETGAHPAP